jgi:hypothetical protein
VSVNRQKTTLNPEKIWPNLKTLKIYDVLKKPTDLKDFDGMALIKFIGENLTSLEHLELVLSESIVEEVIQYLRTKFSQHGCNSRKQNLSDQRGYEWLITIRKY